jgi:hypothetical protein
MDEVKKFYVAYEVETLGVIGIIPEEHGNFDHVNQLCPEGHSVSVNVVEKTVNEEGWVDTSDLVINADGIASVV